MNAEYLDDRDAYFDQLAKEDPANQAGPVGQPGPLTQDDMDAYLAWRAGGI